MPRQDRLEVALVALFLAMAPGCSSKVPAVTAKQITTRADLIGGPGALGDVGDFLLANEEVRVIVQGPGYSRGFGLYGGSLIDADLVRPREAGGSDGGRGYDNFAELFPAIFLKAMRPGPTGVSAVQNPDGSGSIIVTGSPAEFLFMTGKVNELLLDGTKLIFRNEYRLAPGKRYLEIITSVINQSNSDVELPGPGVSSLGEGLSGLRLPVGDVILFGAGNDVFSEHAGFNLRFTLEALYQHPPALPKLPGLVTPFLATRGRNISYGYVSGISDPELSFVGATGYENVPADSIVVPFVASSFTGAFMGAAPRVLEARKSFSYKRYFIIGGGDVASIRDAVHEIKGTPTGTFAGVVRDGRTLAPEAGASVVTFDASGSPYDQHTTASNGSFRGTYAPGHYVYRIVSDGRPTTEPVGFDVIEGGFASVDVLLPAPGSIAVRVRDEDGRLLPAKCSLVGTYSEEGANLDPKTFLYDLALGEPVRPTDLIPDTSVPSTREFIEKVVYAPNGQKTEAVRPGTYRVVCSRGLEYDVREASLEVRAGALAQVDVVLPRAIDTKGWASGDYHLHADPSIDSSMSLEARVGHAAEEGLDIACSSDHNFVTDYRPVIARLGLQDWIHGMVGLELTTLEIGHFNGFPLSYDPGPITKGSFEWSGRVPADLMRELRGHGKLGPEHTVVQVNHPRDSIIGYFNDFGYNQETGEAEESGSVLLRPEGPEFGPQNLSYDFDALEVYNGKRFELLHSYRVPAQLPPPPLPEVVPPAGEILRDADGRIAFPGGIEDWFSLLDRGIVRTAMANSDSHSPEDEPGTPRTYVPVSDDRPSAISELEVVDAIKHQKAMLTNGPFLRLSVEGTACFTQAGENLGRASCGMGEVASARAGGVQVKLAVDTAPWVAVDKVTFYRSGQPVRTLTGDRTTLASVDETVAVERDGYLVVEVSGTRSMWPVITPLEIPPLQVSDAIGSIAGSFGIALNPFGNLQPSQITITYPFAFTNPVFLDADGDGRYSPPGISRQGLRAASSAPRASAKRPDPRGMSVLVKVFGAFAGHGHR